MDNAKPAPRAIIADDEPHVRTFLRMLLGDIGVRVIGEVPDGARAVELFRERRPDLMLLDLNMPIKTGEEVLKEVLADFPEATIIILSSKADRETVQRCAALGAANYIRKDCAPAEIVDIVSETLNRSPEK